MGYAYMFFFVYSCDVYFLSVSSNFFTRFVFSLCTWQHSRTTKLNHIYKGSISRLSNSVAVLLMDVWKHKSWICERYEGRQCLWKRSFFFSLSGPTKYAPSPPLPPAISLQRLHLSSMEISKFQSCVDASSFSVPWPCLSKTWGQGTSKGIPPSDQLSGRRRGTRNQPRIGIYWVPNVSSTSYNTQGKTWSMPPWGSHLNRTDEVRHNWLNAYPVLMTSLWEPKSPSEKALLFTKP